MGSSKVWLVLGFVLIVRLIFFVFGSQKSLSNAQNLTIYGQVKTVPQITSRSQKFWVGQYQVVAPMYPSYDVGDELKIMGRLASPSGGNSGNFTMVYPQIFSVKKTGEKTLQQNLVLFYNQHLPQPEAGLATGIILGDRSNLDANFKAKLRLLGLSHVVVASGTNLTLTAAVAMPIGVALLGARFGLLPAYILIFLYMYITGFDIATVRAGIIVGFAYAGKIFGRLVNPWRSLLMVIYIMILFDPAVIASLSFLLSVTAFAGIVASENYKHLIKWDIVRQTLFAQLVTLPIIWYTFGYTNLLGVLINVCLVWTVPFIMLLGGLALIFKEICLWPMQILLTFFVTVCQWFSTINFTVLTLPQINLATSLGIYLVLIAIYLKNSYAKK